MLANGLVYFGSDDGTLYAIDQGDGELEWQFKTAKKITSTPAVDKGVLYFVVWGWQPLRLECPGRQ